MPHTHSHYDFNAMGGMPLLRPFVVQMKGGFLAQIYAGNEVLWESKKLYKDHCCASEKANKKVAKSLERLLNGESK